MGGFTTKTGTVSGCQAQRRHLPCVETQMSQKMVGCLPWGFSVQGLYSYIYIHMCVCDILYNPFKYIIIKILVLKYGYKYLFEFNYVICTCNMVWWYIIVHDHPRHVPRVVKSQDQSGLRRWLQARQQYVSIACLWLVVFSDRTFLHSLPAKWLLRLNSHVSDEWPLSLFVVFHKTTSISARPIPGTRMKIAGCNRLLNREISLVSGSNFKWPSYLEDGWPNTSRGDPAKVTLCCL